MRATEECSVAAVEALPKAGADPERRSQEGLIARDLIAHQITILSQAQENPDSDEETRSYFEKTLTQAIACREVLDLAVSH